MRHPVILALVSFGLGLVSAPSASAQSLTPMKADIYTFSDQAAMRLNVRNPYDSATRFSVHAYTENWVPINDVRFSRDQFNMAAGSTAPLTVVAPLNGATSQTMYVCVLSQPIYGAGTGLRGQVCGKYRAIQRAAWQ